MKHYEIWTDGSAKCNGKSGAVAAAAWICYLEGEKIIEKAFLIKDKQTNQRAELEAVISACKETILNDDDKLTIHTDSAYIINCINQKWYINWLKNGWKNAKKNPVANKDLWEQLIPYFTDSRYNFIKTKGHSDDAYNNEVDRLVQNLAERSKNDFHNNSIL